MATQVQFRRGTKTEHNIFTGANAEVTVNTTNKSLHVHDGVTVGGIEVARADLSNHSGVGVLTATTFSGNLTGEVNAVSFDTSPFGVVVTGVTTSTSGFVGNLTGNVTGNLTGEVNAVSFDTNSSGVFVTGVTTSTSGFVGNLTGDVTGNINSSGVSTFSNVVVGGATTELIVDGDTRITGILTIGTSSITLNGIDNTIKIGTGLTLTESGSANYAGIVTALGFSGNLTGDVTGNLTGEVNAVSFDTNSSGVVVTGITTSTSGFVGNLTGNVTGNADTATILQTSRTFEITGDIVASAISFNGSGNVSLAATIQPNSVGLGTDTTGEYVSNITGTANQITVTSGIGEGSSPILSIPNQFTAPQDVTVTRDLLVDRDLTVNGSITIGGTSATLFSQELKVYDPDIVLGFRTDAFGNDISTDNTANHGGIAVASTEGTPLISLYDVGIGETNPATYKKIMWFKSGTFSGLGTDAWISNYAIGIGSTQVPDGVRLSAGGMQVTDSTIIAPQLNISGVGTIPTFNSTDGTITTLNSTNATLTNINSSGVSTFSNVVVGGATTELIVVGDARITGILTIGTASITLDGGNETQINVGSGVTVHYQNGVIVEQNVIHSTGVRVNQIIVSGIATASSFIGPLTGNVTGTATSTTNIPNLSGDITSSNTVTTLATVNSNVGSFGDAGAIPTITVNAKGLVTGVTTTAVNNGTLTLNTSGTGLSGSTTFTANQSGNTTFTVTSNATSANTASTIVARDGSGNFTAGTITAGDFNSTSDINLKKDIEVIQNATEILTEINGVKFSWKEKGGKSVGVIAQDVEKVLPELVNTTDKGTKTVNYDGLIGVLIESIKEQQKQIDSLRSQLSNLINQQEQ